MKWTKFFMASILAIGMTMTACSNDDNDEPKTGGGVDGEGGTAYVNFNVQLPTAKLKAGTETGTAAENDVAEMAIVLYAKGDGLAKYVWNFKVTGATTGNEMTQTGAVCTTDHAKAVVKRDYWVVVLVNPIAASVPSVGAAMSTIEGLTASATSSNLASFTTASKFFMTNTSGPVELKEEELQPTATDAETTSNRKVVNVERAVAKVVVLADSPIANSLSIAGNIGASTDITWTLNVTNQDSYYMRHLNNKGDGVLTANTSTYGVGAMETVNDYVAGRDKLYAKSVNYQTTDYEDTAKPADGDHLKAPLSTQFSYITTGLTFGNVLSTTVTPGNTGYVSQYAFENTMEHQAQHQYVTTSVMLQIPYIPTVVASETDKSFYVYEGKAYSQKNINDLLAEVDASTMQDVFNAVVTAGKQVDGSETTGFTQSVSVTVDGNSKSFIVRYYKNGNMYYNVPIRHFDNTIQPNKMYHGRWGLVRNNVYQVTIEAISSLGYTTPTTPNLIDDAEWFIAFKVNIMPWFIRTQGVEL